MLDSFKETHLDDKMIALVQKLKERYLVGMVTDNMCDRIEAVLEHRGLRQYFDVVAISASLHSGKDSHSIFEYVLNTLNVSASECVFIDNSEKNLNIPKQIGMSTIFYNDDNRDYNLFINELEKIIL